MGRVQSTTSSIEAPTQPIFGLRIHAVTASQAVDECDRAIREKRTLRIGVVNAAKIVNMRKSSLLRESITTSDLILADGAAVVWASRILRRPLPERVAGADLFESLLALAGQKGYSVYLLGARSDVLERTYKQIRQRFPGVNIAGRRDGYFTDLDAPSVAKDIGRSKADMLFVGITSPKKELFMARFGNDLNTAIVHGVGGSFDVLAGVVRRAPLAWQKAGLEWLYRLLQEPKRMWKRYLVTNSVFIWIVLSEVFRRRANTR